VRSVVRSLEASTRKTCVRGVLVCTIPSVHGRFCGIPDGAPVREREEYWFLEPVWDKVGVGLFLLGVAAGFWWLFVR